jgi:hypothetical protein
MFGFLQWLWRWLYPVPMVDSINTPSPFRLFGPRTGLVPGVGVPDGEALNNIPARLIPDGAMCFIRDNRTLYEYREGDTTPQSLPNVVAPSDNEMGRWHLLTNAVQSLSDDVAVTTNDTNPGVLNDKLVVTGAGITKQVLNPGGNEQLELDVPGASPGGVDQSVQYNDSGALGGDANFKWDKNNGNLFVQGVTGGSGVFLNQMANVSIFSGGPGANGIFILNGQSAVQATGNGAVGSNVSLSNFENFIQNAAGVGTPTWTASGFVNVFRSGPGGGAGVARWSGFDVIELGDATPNVRLTSVTETSIAAGRLLSWDGTQNVYIDGPINLNNTDLQNAKVIGYNADINLGDLTGASVPLDFTPGARQSMQISGGGNVTFTSIVCPAVGEYQLIVDNPAGETITWPGAAPTYRFRGGTTNPYGAGNVTVYRIYYDGTRYLIDPGVAPFS